MAEPSDTVLLPSNPNAVVFTAPASQVLANRSWGRVLELALGPLLTLQHASDLPCAAGFGWRVGLDRKNRRTLRLAMYFVIDGRLAAEALDQLERAVGHNSVHWSTSHVERIPANGELVLHASDGRARLLVGPGVPPVTRGLRLEADGPRWGAIPVTAATVDARDVLNLPTVVGRLPAYEDADEDLERMRLAFAHTFARRIVEADGVVQDDEARFMEEVFRPSVLSRLGIAGYDGMAHWLAEAQRELPERLGHHDKLALIGLFFSACYSDGTLDAREMKVLKDASDALGVERERVVEYLQRFW